MSGVVNVDMTYVGRVPVRLRLETPRVSKRMSDNLDKIDGVCLQIKM